MKSKLCRLAGLCIVSVTLLSLSIACTSPLTDKPSSPVESSTFPLEITDQSGRVVIIEKMPEKIISLAPSNTEIVYALGLENRLVGVTKYCNYPESAKDKTKIGEFSTIDIERVIEIQPDLILATSMHKDEIVPQLERLDLTVLTTAPKTIDEVLGSINLIGKAADSKEEASQLVTGLSNRIKVVTDKTSALSEAQRPGVFYILWHDPLQTVGAETLIHELIVKAGGINIARELDGNYPTISLEAVLMANPQIVIAESGHGAGENLPFQFILNEPRLQEIAARQSDKIYEIDSDLPSRPGPRIVDGLEKLAEFIHPELFKEPR